jgi:hypothetical protein
MSPPLGSHRARRSGPGNGKISSNWIKRACRFSAIRDGQRLIRAGGIGFIVRIGMDAPPQAIHSADFI